MLVITSRSTLTSSMFQTRPACLNSLGGEAGSIQLMAGLNRDTGALIVGDDHILPFCSWWLLQDGASQTDWQEGGELLLGRPNDELLPVQHQHLAHHSPEA